MSENDSTRFEWLATESLAPTFVEELEASGIEVDRGALKPVPADRLPDTDDPGFEPLLLIAGAASIAYLAKTISRIVRNHRHGGVVIDTRTAALTITDGVRGVDAGTIVVVAPEGSQVFQAPDEAGLLQALASR